MRNGDSLRNKNKQKLFYLFSFSVLFISLFCLYRFWTASSELENSSQNQSSLSESEKSPEKPDSINRHEDFREKEKNKKTRSLSQTASQNPNSVFETFDLSPEEVELFHGRRHEPREATLAISGLKIDGKTFKAENREDLPLKLVVPLPGGEGQREFTRTFVDFQNGDSFVWVGTAKDNTLDSFHLSFYQGVMVGSIETSKGSYEIKQLRGNKNIIRKIDRSVFPRNENDVVFPKPPKDKQSLKPSLKENGQSKTQLSNSVEAYTQSQVQVDMVLGFSHLIKNSEGSLRAAKALMNLFVGVANTTHRNSKTGVVINVRVMTELRVSSLSSLRDNIDHMEKAYSVETGGSGFDRNNPYHHLAYKRYQTSSDLTALVTEKSADRLCGIATFPIDSKLLSSSKTVLPSVTAANCPKDTLSHEIGHNMGAMHERDKFTESRITRWTKLGIYPYAYAFRSMGHVSTTMADYCGRGCPHALYFSGPNHSYSSGGQTLVLGVANKMDNSRAIRERSSEIARVSTLRPGLGLQIPRITRQPKVPSSGSLTLEVTAVDPNTPKRPLSYQWYKNGRVLSGEKTNRLVIQPSSVSGNHKYYVVVSNDVGQIQSTEVRVSLRGPQITRQPVGGFINSNLGLTLEVAAINPNPAPNNGALSFQWYRNKSPINNKEGRSPRLLVRPSSNFEFQSTYYVEVSYRGEVTRSDEVQVAFGVRLRSSKWESLLDPSTDPSLIEIGQIDRSLDLKRTPGESEEGVMRELANEE